jgi:DNA polymerase III alpha subunit
LFVEDYLKRTYELGHKTISTVEHGWVGNYFDSYLKIEKFNKKLMDKGESPLKWIFGGEFYWVKDRFAKDRTNSHIVILARNENGRKNINRIMSQCNKDGYYYRPRIDIDLILSLPSDDVFIATSCLAFWKYEDIDNIVLKLNERFKHFYLEVQAHHTEIQKGINRHIIELSKKHNIPIIAGVDSHVISNKQLEEREDFLKSNAIHHEGEEGWFLDFPDYETLFDRFKQQGVLSDFEIEIALENTNKTLEFEDIILNKDMKIPTLYPDLLQKEKDNKLKELINEAWKKERDSVPKELHKKYLAAIRYEVNEIIGCSMSDYFTFNREVIKLGIEKYKGVLTKTGRGSAVSMYSNKLLGFTGVDRISAKVTMYPERFLTKERVLESHTPPDIDFNVADRAPFIKAQKDLLGEKNIYDLLAFGTLKFKSAWKMYSRAYNVTPTDADIVSKQIDKYEQKLKYAERDELGELVEEFDIYDFVDIKYKDLIEGCKKYLGIKTTRKGHPCGCIVSPVNVEEEIGVILCKSETTKKETLVACIESGTIDAFGWLKNDFLFVDVVKTTDEIYKRLNIESHSIDDLLKIIEHDQATWDIYKNGLTLCVNQLEKSSTKKKTMQYSPINIVELASLIAGVRPSFKELIKQFLSREDFKYGIKELDDLLQTPEMPYSYIFYQEQLMQILEFAGINVKETYDIIKSISKKKTYCRDCENTGNDGMKICPRCGSRNIAPYVEKIEEEFVQGFKNKIGINDDAIVKEVWDIILAFAKYGFNASHAYCMALDSGNQAYLKAHYPEIFYEVMLENYTEKGNKDKVKALKDEMKHFGIKMGEIKFGQDNRGFKADIENKGISQSIKSFKQVNQDTANVLYDLSKYEYNSVVDLFVKIKEFGIDKGKMDVLINLGYFEDYGNINYIQTAYDLFREHYDRKLVNSSSVYYQFLMPYAAIKTEKQIREIDTKQYILDQLNNIDKTISDSEQIITDFRRYEYSEFKNSETNKDCYVIINNLQENESYSPNFELYNIKTGQIRIAKSYKKDRLKIDETVIISKFKNKPKQKYIGIDEKTGDPKYEPLDTNEDWIDKFYKISI